jgi:hypothetical protein
MSYTNDPRLTHGLPLRGEGERKKRGRFVADIRMVVMKLRKERGQHVVV